VSETVLSDEGVDRRGHVAGERIGAVFLADGAAVAVVDGDVVGEVMPLRSSSRPPLMISPPADVPSEVLLRASQMPAEMVTSR